MINLYDTKNQTYGPVSEWRWLFYRLIRSKRYVTALIGDKGYDFTGVNKTVVHEHSPELWSTAPLHFTDKHFTAVDIDGRKFLYCPVGNICSWSEGDHDHKWCEWCKKGFEELNR